MAGILAASSPADWLPLDPESTFYLDLPAGRVVIALAPQLAPLHVANLRTLVREHFFDGLAIVRSQDNYVVQWGDPDAESPVSRRSLGSAKTTLPPEFDGERGDLPVTFLPDGDVYAPRVGWSDGFPVGVDEEEGRIWPLHCYGMVGVGRGDALDSGNGSELYATIGHAPRHLDRNVALIGRVVKGMELLSTLPRGSGPLGFYEKPEQRVPILSLRLASDVPIEHRERHERLRTDTPTFTALVEARRNRRESWFARPAGRIEVCNVPLPVRATP
jgi:peptidylprolyl isomerase